MKGYTEAWAAPEILEKGDKATPEADIFAFGMVVIEVGLCVSLHLTSKVDSHLIPGQGFHWDVPIQRLHKPNHRFKDHGWRTAHSSEGGTRTGSDGLLVEDDPQLLGARACSSTDGDGSGRAPPRMVSVLPLHRTNIMTCFLQLWATYFESAFVRASSIRDPRRDPVKSRFGP